MTIILTVKVLDYW